MKKVLFLLLFLTIGTAIVKAQVRIGGNSAPNASAILDLNPSDANDASLGLSLPRVRLVDVNAPDPMPGHVPGLMVYNMASIPEKNLQAGVYYNNGTQWYPVFSAPPSNPGSEPPIIFIRQPGFLWLGATGEYTDTLGFELAAVDKSGFTYQWYKRDPVTQFSSPLVGATADSLFITPANRESYGITAEGKVYEFYCVVVSGTQYALSGTGRAVYGIGARLANGGWIRIANHNLGAVDMPLADQLAYTPSAAKAPNTNDKAYDPTVYGDLYQWGRKKDGHEKRDVPASGTYAAYLNKTNGIGLDSLNATDGQIKDGLADVYGKFIQRNAGTNDWRVYPETADNSATNPANSWTWGNPVDGVTDNDPCRSEMGAPWRVPTQAEWAMVSANNSTGWVDFGAVGIAGTLIRPGGASAPASVFLPAAGNRSRGSGAINDTRLVATAQSSSASGTNAGWLRGDGSGTAMPTWTRGFATSVRCIAD